jgi:SAM-dependent methyltransferase
MPCKLCSSSAPPESLFRGIVRCPGCGLKYFPYESGTENLYQAEYFHGVEYQNYSGDKETLQRNFRGRLKELLKICPAGKLLELGCAYGFFLELAKNHYQVKGCDITRDGVESARRNFGVDAVCADFLSLPEEPDSYDLVCLWDTIEHLPEPFLFLQKAGRWLKPGGHLVLTTGDIGSIAARLRGEHWRLIHPPTHLFYFDRESISRALKAAGLELVDFRHVGQSRSYRSMAYEIFVLRNPGLRWIFQLLTLGGRLDFPVYLNTFDIMQVTARRLQK